MGWVSGGVLYGIPPACPLGPILSIAGVAKAKWDVIDGDRRRENEGDDNSLQEPTWSSIKGDG